MDNIQLKETVSGTGIGRQEIFLFCLCFLSSAIGGTVSTLMSVYLPVAVKDLLGNKGDEELNQISAYINAIFILGWAIGGFVWGMISDAIGRKKALLLAIGSYGVATILTGLMKSWESIVICRMISGFGVGGVLVIAFTFMSEVWPQKSRAIYIGILSIGIPVGIFSAGLINYIVSSWRQGFMVGIIPVFIAIAGAWLLEEPKSWKINHSAGTRQRHNLSTLFSRDHRNDLWVGSLTFGTMLIGLWAIFLWLPTWIQHLLPGTDAGRERGLSMMLLGIGGLSGGFLSGWFGNAIGLRKAMMVCFAVCAILSFILFKTNDRFNNFIFVEIGILAFFFGLSQGILSAYIPQLFPTHIRATATGFCFNIGRIFTATAVLIVGVLVNWLGGYGNALFIFSFVFLVGLLSLLLIREKK